LKNPSFRATGLKVLSYIPSCEDAPCRQPNLFVKINLEDLVPAEHPLRGVKRLADEALLAMSRTFAAAYEPAERGERLSIPLERLLDLLVNSSLGGQEERHNII